MKTVKLLEYMQICIQVKVLAVKTCQEELGGFVVNEEIISTLKQSLHMSALTPVWPDIDQHMKGCLQAPVSQRWHGLLSEQLAEAGRLAVA